MDDKDKGNQKKGMPNKSSPKPSRKRRDDDDFVEEEKVRKKKKKGGIPEYVIALLVVGVLAIGGVTIWLLSGDGKKKETASSSVADEPEQSTSTSSSGSGSTTKPKQPQTNKVPPTPYTKPTFTTIQPKVDMVALLRFWDSAHNEHVYTVGEEEPANWRKNPAFKDETIVGYGSHTPIADMVRLERAYCRDGRHYYYLKKPDNANDIERMESIDFWVWMKPAEGRVPMHACFQPNKKDAFFDSSLDKIRNYATKDTKEKRNVIEGMFYLYPTASAPALLTQSLTVNETQAVNLPPLKQKETFSLPKSMAICATPDGKVAVGGIYNGVTLVDRTAKANHASLVCEGTTYTRVAISLNGQSVAAWAALNPSILHVWDVKTGAEYPIKLKPQRLDHTVSGNTVVVTFQSQRLDAVLSPDGKTLYYATDNEDEVTIWDIAARKATGSLPHARATSLSIMPDGKFLTTCDSTYVRIWDLMKGGELVTTLPNHDGILHVAALTPNGKTAAIGTTQGTILLWDIGVPTPRMEIKAHHNAVSKGYMEIQALAISPDGKTLVSAGLGAAGIWDIATGRGLAAAQVGDKLTSSVHALAITDGGKTLLTMAPVDYRAALAGNKAGGINSWDLSSISHE